MSEAPLADEPVTQENIVMFLGWLCGRLPELHDIECPKLIDAWDEWRGLAPGSLEAMPPLSDEGAAKLIDAINTQAALEKVSNERLVDLVLRAFPDDGKPRNAIIDEVCTRLDPTWGEREPVGA